jgi:hypothetical protein
MPASAGTEKPLRPAVEALNRRIAFWGLAHFPPEIVRIPTQLGISILNPHGRLRL